MESGGRVAACVATCGILADWHDNVPDSGPGPRGFLGEHLIEIDLFNDLGVDDKVTPVFVS